LFAIARQAVPCGRSVGGDRDAIEIVTLATAEHRHGQAGVLGDRSTSTNASNSPTSRRRGDSTSNITTHVGRVPHAGLDGTSESRRRRDADSHRRTARRSTRRERHLPPCERGNFDQLGGVGCQPKSEASRAAPARADLVAHPDHGLPWIFSVATGHPIVSDVAADPGICRTHPRRKRLVRACCDRRSAVGVATPTGPMRMFVRPLRAW
jgi:hypothetical protein